MWLFQQSSPSTLMAHKHQLAHRFACGKGHLPIVHWLRSLDERFYEHAYSDICTGGHLHTAKYLAKRAAVAISEDDDIAFREACYYAQLKVAKWLFEEGGRDMSMVHANEDDAFQCACARFGALRTAQWIFGLGDVNIHANDGAAFMFSCASGRLDTAMWLMQLGAAADIYANNFHTGFQMACKHGRLQTAKWLAKLEPHVTTHAWIIEGSYHFYWKKPKTLMWLLKSGGRIMVREIADGAFKWFCAWGCLRPACWLVGLGVNIPTVINSAFERACESGALEVAVWLRELVLDDVDMRETMQTAFQKACTFGHLSTAKWLVLLGGVDIHAKNDEAFVAACRNGFLRTAKWLVKCGGVNIHAQGDHAFCITGYPEMKRWLMSNDPHWPWDPAGVDRLKKWGPLRDAWIQAVLASVLTRHHACS